MRRARERVFSLLLALVLVCGLVPVGSWAAGTQQAYVTISVAGELKTKQLAVSLSDRDGDGAVTVNDVLMEAHDQEYPGGAAAGYESANTQDGLSLVKLWGDSSGSFGYWKNDASCWSLADSVSDGDYVTAFVYRDKVGHSDQYSYFDTPEKTAISGETLALTLYAISYDQNYNPVSQPMEGAGVSVDGSPTGQRTNRQGQVPMVLQNPGTYVVSASYYSTNPPACIVPAVCTVTVYDKTNANLVTVAADRLTWNAIKGNNSQPYVVTEALTLPGQVSVAGETVSVAWECLDGAGAFYVYSDGSTFVDRPAEQDVSCTLTATVTYGSSTVRKSIPLTIKAEGVNADKETVVAYGELMTQIAASYVRSDDPWTVLDVAAYSGMDVKDGAYASSSSLTAIALADAAIGESVERDTLDGVDITNPYAIYTIPYLSLAYQAAGIPSQARLEEMKASMEDYLDNLAANYAGVDEVAPILAALAPYYQQGDAEVDRVVNSAVTWLSEQQGGGWYFLLLWYQQCQLHCYGRGGLVRTGN